MAKRNMLQTDSPTAIESPTFAVNGGDGLLLKSFDVVPTSNGKGPAQLVVTVEQSPLPPPPELISTPSTFCRDACYRCKAALLVLPVACACLPLLVFDLFRSWAVQCCCGRCDIKVRQLWSIHVFCALASGVLGFITVLLSVAVGHYEVALRLTDRFQLQCSSMLIARVPWPAGRMTKVEALACLNRAKDVSRFVGLEQAASDFEARRASLDMWRATKSTSSRIRQCHRFEVIQRCVERGADLDFPDMDGGTILHCFARQDQNVDRVRWLLLQNASPNVQDVCGETPLHLAATGCGFRNSGVIPVLLRDSRTDPCIFNKKGDTPFMKRLKNRLPPEPLRPEVPWDVIEYELELASVDRRIGTLLALVPDCKGLPALRLPDHLFCRIKEELNTEELLRRRQCLWDLLLKPVMLDIAVKRELQAPERAVLLYVWDSTRGPPKVRFRALRPDAHELNLTLVEAEEVFAQELRNLHQTICNDHCARCFLQLPTHCLVDAAELHHGRFYPAPDWALNSDIVVALRNLERLRMIRSSQDVCDLMRLGWLSSSKSCSLPSWAFRSDIFTYRRRLRRCSCRRKSPSKLEFWMGLVALWLFALHRYLTPVFHRKMQSVVTSQEMVLTQPRDFDYIMVQAHRHITERSLRSWEEKVLAPLWVVDILACTCEVASAERALAVEKALLLQLKLVSRENSHSVSDVQGGRGVLHRKLILLLQADFTHLGQVCALVEVKIYLAAYASVNRRMQLVHHVRTGS